MLEEGGGPEEKEGVMSVWKEWVKEERDTQIN